MARANVNVENEAAVDKGGGPEGISGAQQDLFSLGLEPGGQLSDGGGLAHPVDPDEKDYRRPGIQRQAGIPHVQHILQHAAQASADLVPVLELLAPDPLP